MEEKYREYVIYIDDRKFKYTIFKEFEPKTNIGWYDFINTNLNSTAENRFLLHSKYIRVYAISPSVGEDLLITEFETAEIFKEEKERKEEGIKYDNGKPLVGTMLNVFPYALMEIGAVIEFGTHKYPDPNNWKLVKNAKKRYQDALMRHLLKYNQGKEIDEETGRPHLAHMAWNALALLELYLMERQNGGTQTNE